MRKHCFEIQIDAWRSIAARGKFKLMLHVTSESCAVDLRWRVVLRRMRIHAHAQRMQRGICIAALLTVTTGRSADLSQPQSYRYVLNVKRTLSKSVI